MSRILSVMLDPELLAAADRLDAQSIQLREAADKARFDAAKTRARAAREAGGTSVKARRYQATSQVMTDPLLPVAGVAVETMRGEFSTQDMAVRLRIADTNRVHLLLGALVEMGKINTAGHSRYRVPNSGPDRLRDYICEAKICTVEEAASACELPEEEVDRIAGLFLSQGMVEWDPQGRITYVEPGTDSSARARRRPPEKDPPCFSDAVARGLPVRIVDHGKASKATTRHQMNQRQKRWERQEQAKEARAEGQRRKAAGQ